MDWRVEATHWWRWGPHDPAVVWSGIGGQVPLAEVEAYCDLMEQADHYGPWQAPTGSGAPLYTGTPKPGADLRPHFIYQLVASYPDGARRRLYIGRTTRPDLRSIQHLARGGDAGWRLKRVFAQAEARGASVGYEVLEQGQGLAWAEAREAQLIQQLDPPGNTERRQAAATSTS